MPPIARPSKESIAKTGIKVAGIRKLHSLSRMEDNIIVGRELSCRDCIMQKTTLCQKCQVLKPINKISSKVNHEEEQEEITLEGADIKDGGDSDAEKLSDDENEEKRK